MSEFPLPPAKVQAYANTNGVPVKTDDETQVAKRGGVRKGAGRKPLDVDGTIVVTARLTGKQKAAFDMVGGVQWLRAQMDLFTNED